MANKCVQLRNALGENIFPRIDLTNVENLLDMSKINGLSDEFGKKLDASVISNYSTTEQMTAAIGEAIAGVNSFEYVVLGADEELPTGENAKSHTIYLKPRTAGVNGKDVYDEYILINGEFELIGNTELDLSNYYTKGEVDSAIDTDVAALKAIVDAYTVNGKTIATSPVLSGADIVLTGYTAVEGGVGIAAEDSINAAFEKIDENFKTLSGDSTESLGAIVGRVTTLEGEMDAAEGRLDDVEDRLDAIDGEAGEIAGIKSRLDAVEGEADVINAALGADLLVAGAVPSALALKANAADVYTKDEVDGVVEGINGNIDLKANAADVYTKDDIDGTVEGINGEIAKKADAETTYTKTEVDALLISFVEVDPATGEPVVQG